MDVEKLIERLREKADDPMWADHAEISKAGLRAAADALATLAAENAALRAKIAELSPHPREPIIPEGPFSMVGNTR